MEITNVTEHDDGRNRMVRVDDITWMSEPDSPLEEANLLALEDAELLAYVAELRQDTRAVRALLHESLTVVRRLTVQSDRFQLRIGDLLGALRLAREEARALHAQLRALQDEAA